jgi:hypothetical protein
MFFSPFSYLVILIISCGSAASYHESEKKNEAIREASTNPEGGWAYFLQHLPVEQGKVLDYSGRPVDDQDKQVGIIPYDVGKRDLQQCADALMRLRAEYLFSRKRFDEIGFHFVSGHHYTWKSYCQGKRPVPNGNSIRFVNGAPAPETHESLRRYLDIVYTYASTLSLARELKPATDFEIGTVVINPGSPGHCFIIIDEIPNPAGGKLFKLAEGYTPAQSIYVLRNSTAKGNSPWHSLNKERIETASYLFRNFQLKKFE